MRRKRTALRVMATAMTFSALSAVGLLLHQNINFSTQFDEYLRSACREENSDKAVSKAQHALDFLVARNLTTGKTAILYESPETDVGDWYEGVEDAIMT